jgi:hypothetical protein
MAFATLRDEQLDKFTLAYIEAALWSSNDEDGDSLDQNYSVNDLAPETLEKIKADCQKFQAENADALAVGCSRPKQMKHWLGTSPEFYTDSEQAGHDFWLTRNGHGSGFWDGDWPEPEASELTKASKAFGEYELYVGDDGKLYGMRG